MTHFSVLVIGDKPEEQLAPYHAFECTGVDDQYVVDVDVTGDYRESYETGFLTRCQDAAGILYDPEEDRFFREPTSDEAEAIGLLEFTGVIHGQVWRRRDWGDGQGYRAKIHYGDYGRRVDTEGVDDPACVRDTRLFAVRCVQQVPHMIKDERTLVALNVAERYAVIMATEARPSAAYTAAGLTDRRMTAPVAVEDDVGSTPEKPLGVLP